MQIHKTSNMTKTISQYSFVTIFMAAFSLSAMAQKDTTRQIQVTSAYKPVLRNAAKINFSAAAPSADSTPPKLNYNIPAQNLFFSYQPVPLKAVAVAKDSLLGLGNNSYVKAGFGNFSTPYFKAGVALGNGTTSIINVYGDFISQKGNELFQQYSNASASAQAVLRTKSNLEFSLKGGIGSDTYYKYGYASKTQADNKDSLRVSFTNVLLQAGLRNVTPTEFGIYYNPSIRINLFNDNHSTSETHVRINAPLEKTVGQYFAVKLGATLDYSRLKQANFDGINNSVFLLDAAFKLKSPNVNLTAGITPSWDNSNFKLLPNITADYKLKGEELVLQAGYVGTVEKTSYMSLATMNPWINRPTVLSNLRIEEFYGGVKGSVGDHFSYNAKAGYIKWIGMPSIYNDYVGDTTGRSFEVAYNKTEAVEIHGGIALTEAERFSLQAGASIYQVTASNIFDKPLGTYLPFDIHASLRWQVMKNFWLKSDLFVWDGPYFLSKPNPLSVQQKKTGSVDLNAGLEFNITRNLLLWGQFNNILNNKYQRWSQYESLGFNVQGGIIFRFHTKGLTK
jgi:hypothetical protein